jgi:large subunit ribosomal protein L29
MMSTDIKQLNDDLASYYKEYMNLNIQKSTGQLVKPHLLRTVKKNIARVKTQLHMLEAQSDVK